MTEGPFFKKILFFAIPVTLTGLLQIAFNAADMAVIGRFGSARSMAGIGAIGELSWLLVCVVIGISSGSNVVVIFLDRAMAEYMPFLFLPQKLPRHRPGAPWELDLLVSSFAS